MISCYPDRLASHPLLVVYAASTSKQTSAHILELAQEGNPWIPAKYQHLSSVRLTDLLKALLVATNRFATVDTCPGRPPQRSIFSQQASDLRVQSHLCRGSTEVSLSFTRQES